MTGNVAVPVAARPASLVPAGAGAAAAASGRSLTTRLVAYAVTTRTVATRLVAYPVEAAVKRTPTPPTAADPVAPVTAADCCPVAAPGAVFRRVVVDNRVAGGTVVRWDLDPDFADDGPYTFQLQVSRSGTAADWADAGPPAVDPPYLTDAEQRSWGVGEVVQYRVLLTSTLGTYASPAARPATVLPEADWLIVQELTRKERLRQAGLAGTPGLLYKARRYGTRCRCVNPDTRERHDSACETCFGTAWVGGYHDPVRCTFGELPPSESRLETAHVEGRGTVEDTVLKVRLDPGTWVAQDDLWVSDGDDARYKVHRVWEAVRHRGVVVLEAAEFRRLPRRDVAYRVPLPPGGNGCGWGRTPEDGPTETVCLPITPC